jgi:MFS family permease
VIGPWSDAFQTPLGRRRPFMLVALGPIAFCLALVAFMPSLWLIALLLFAFFFAYYVYEPPYRGLYPDLVPQATYGRSQGVQHLLRGLAIGAGLVGGGFLFDLWHPAPFLIAAGVATAACAVPVVFVHEERRATNRVFEGIGTYVRHSWRILHANPEVRRFLVCNSAWEGAFAGMRTFVVLYVVVGLHESVRVSTEILATVAVGYVVAALYASVIADKFGIARVIFYASFVYAGGLFIGGVAQSWHPAYLLLLFPVTIAGGLVMTLAWGLLFQLMPAQDRGAIAGLATTTKGIGLVTGPILAGAAIDLLAPHLEATEGYQALWPILGVPVAAVIPLVWKLRCADRLSGREGHPAA